MSKPLIMWAAIVTIKAKDYIDSQSFQPTRAMCRAIHLKHAARTPQGQALVGVRFARVEVKEIQP